MCVVCAPCGSVLNNYYKWFGVDQVCDLARVRDGGPPPEAYLRKYIHLPACRVLVGGGDGTCGWLLNAITKVCVETRHDCTTTMPIGIMPLGTGNDLSRALNWGPGYQRGMAGKQWMHRLAEATPELLDRWRVTMPACRGLPKAFTPFSGKRASLGGVERNGGILLNYLSVGTEAAGLFGFHAAREKDPESFNNRLTNQLKMVYHGAPYAGALAPCGVGARQPQLKSAMTVRIRRSKGSEWEDLILPKHCPSLLLVNIRSHAAGRKPWEPNRAPWPPSSPSDGLIDIVAFTSLTHSLAYAPSRCPSPCTLVPPHHPAYRHARTMVWRQLHYRRLRAQVAAPHVATQACPSIRRLSRPPGASLCPGGRRAVAANGR